jgi:hypothetical protein
MKDIVEYKNSCLLTEDGKPCMVHVDFVPFMDMLCQYLKLAECTLHVNSSFRLNSDHIQGAVVKPASHSNHFAGFAIDANVIDSKGKIWSAQEMKQPTAEVLMFINLIRRSSDPTKLRWGGDFAAVDNPACDPVHFDHALNLLNPDRWNEIYNSLHSA